MKVYTDYGDLPVKALESCIIEIENILEWTFISKIFEKERDRIKALPELDNFDKKQIAILDKAISALNPQNTLEMSTFDITKVKKGLHKPDNYWK
jgi:hypothetical protein